MEDEIWKDIPGYEDQYQISNKGRCKSLKRNLILKEVKCSHGYIRYKLLKRKVFKAHQLVAMAFMNHIPNKYENVINHKNHIKSDNRLENLEITTQRNNINEYHKTKLKNSSKYPGVRIQSNRKKFSVYMSIKGVKIYCGSSYDENEAGDIYIKALDNIDKYTGCNKTFRNFLKI